MGPTVTNTIIVTSESVNVASNGVVEQVKEWLVNTVLTENYVDSANPLQLVIIRSFKRLAIISPDHVVSESIMDLASTKIESSMLGNTTPSVIPALQFTYSFMDNVTQVRQRLELPQPERLFLISPPSSPPAGFDYSRCEEAPNVKAHHIPQHLESASLGPRTLINSPAGQIIVDPCNSDTVEEASPPEYQRTALPPKSIFDDIDEEEC